MVGNDFQQGQSRDISIKNTACKASDSTCVVVQFGETDYFGRITKFLKLCLDDSVYRLVMLDLHYNSGVSPGGIHRVQRKVFYKTGTVVLLKNLKRRVLFAQRADEDDFFYVLDVRGDLNFSI